jgi:hypothetical protein
MHTSAVASVIPKRTVAWTLDRQKACHSTRASAIGRLGHGHGYQVRPADLDPDRMDIRRPRRPSCRVMRWFAGAFLSASTVDFHLREGTEDGIRTRDPHPGKVVLFVRLGRAGLPRCGSVHPVSSTSMRFAPVMERSSKQRV